VVTALALSGVGPGALVAAGDDGPSGSAPTARPTQTVLRPTEISQPAPQKPSAKEIIIVGTSCVLPALLVVFLGPPLLSLLG
jgi:hypothetical protein